jgi:hypothetical protein
MVPVRYRRHWKNGPPSHAVAQGYDRGYDDRGQGNSQGNSHGNGHGEGKSHKH